jgi:iron complex transport system ATP-binding protein
MSAIRIDGLVVELGDRRILDGIDLDVADSSWVSIVGPNGAGKTTLVRTVAGLVKPHAGRVEVDGVPTHALRARARARLLALVPQAPVIPVGVSVLDYALLGRTPHVSYFGRETAADVAECHTMLERLGVAELAGRPVETLSGGERQRVVLARALLQSAPIVLLDEPTTALDIGHQQDVLELVDHLRRERGIGVITTLHDLTLASRYADRLLLLVDGRTEAEGTATEVLTDEHLSRFYGAQVTVLCVDDGIVIVPRRPSREVRPS